MSYGTLTSDDMDIEVLCGKATQSWVFHAWLDDELVGGPLDAPERIAAGSSLCMPAWKDEPPHPYPSFTFRP